MVTMTLLQGVINSFAIFLARIIAYFASLAVDSKLSTLVYIGVNIGCQLMFTFLGSFITMAFSRHREFRADAGASTLVNKDSMIAALQTLQQKYVAHDPANGLATAKIADRKGMFALLSSHPPLEVRIDALRKL
jgi:heat shock protein HtpX